MKIQVNFIDRKTTTDKTEKTTEAVFRAAGQIMFNYYRLALKRDIRKIKPKYIVAAAKE